MKNVFLITGSPGSGKTTYAKEKAGKNDLIFDLDEIHAALGGELHGNNAALLPVSLSMREAAIEAITNRLGQWNNAYFICASPNRIEIDSLCRQLEATEIKMKATLEECQERINNDTTRLNKEEQLALVNRWFSNNKKEDDVPKMEDKEKVLRDEMMEIVRKLKDQMS